MRNACVGVRVTITKAKGSTPQPAGAMMLVSREHTAGTIGGGRLEWVATDRARQWLNTVSGALVSRHAHEESLSLGPGLGQCCGGSVQLRYELIDEALIAAWPDEPEQFELHLFGMGHVATALVETLSPIACAIHWYDERAEYVESTRRWLAHRVGQRSTHARIVCHEESGADCVPVGSDRPGMALVMTHSHAIDFDLCLNLLCQEHWNLVGLIGSNSKRTRFLRRLEQRGLDERQRARLVCPIGVAGMRLKQPEWLAISVAAQLLQLATAAPTKASGQIPPTPPLATPFKSTPFESILE